MMYNWFFFVSVVVVVFLILGLTYIIVLRDKKSGKKREGTSKNPLLLSTQMQAYERLVLFVERNYPPNGIHKLYDESLSIKDLRYLLVETIEKEYEHNITQQVYVSAKAWQAVKNYKEHTVMICNLVADLCVQEKVALKAYVTRMIEVFSEAEQAKRYKLVLDALQFEAKYFLFS